MLYEALEVYTVLALTTREAQRFSGDTPRVPDEQPPIPGKVFTVAAINMHHSAVARHCG